MGGDEAAGIAWHSGVEAERARLVNDALAALDGEFSRLYAAEGRSSIAPEKLLRASLLQAFFSVRS